LGGGGGEEKEKGVGISLIARNWHLLWDITEVKLGVGQTGKLGGMFDCVWSPTTERNKKKGRRESVKCTHYIVPILVNRLQKRQ